MSLDPHPITAPPAHAAGPDSGDSLPGEAGRLGRLIALIFLSKPVLLAGAVLATIEAIFVLDDLDRLALLAWAAWYQSVFTTPDAKVDEKIADAKTVHEAEITSFLAVEAASTANSNPPAGPTF